MLAVLPIRDFDRERFQRLAHESGARLTLIDKSGRVLGDSDSNPSAMENHATRPEFVMALRGQTGSDLRTSNTLGVMFMYVAVPSGDGALRRCGAVEGYQDESQ